MAKHGVFDVMLLIKTNIFMTAYFPKRIIDEVTCSTVRLASAGGAQGGVGLVTRKRPVSWGIESTRYHDPNMVRCDLVTGLTQTPLVKASLSPSMLEHLSNL